MNHLVIMPVVLPALAAALLLLLRPSLRWQRRAGSALCAALVAVAAWLLMLAAQGGHQVYALGDWPAPFGIVLVLDRLSAMMLLLTSVIAYSRLTPTR
ncbi:MAG: monovalent cation/H+ antiporter subunit D, partial [Rubrivivax sp.]